VPLLALLIRQRADGEEIRGLEKPDPVRQIEALASMSFAAMSRRPAEARREFIW